MQKKKCHVVYARQPAHTRGRHMAPTYDTTCQGYTHRRTRRDLSTDRFRLAFALSTTRTISEPAIKTSFVKRDNKACRAQPTPNPKAQSPNQKTHKKKGNTRDKSTTHTPYYSNVQQHGTHRAGHCNSASSHLNLFCHTQPLI